jgi:deoxycytidine triphosphate deaminase
VYLTDTEIRARLAELSFTCDNPQYPFVPDDQIQPCSIDLRLSNLFWEPSRRSTIDLRKSHLLELAPRRYWRQRVLKFGDHITLRPGRLLLARVYEGLTIPTDCAGRIEGRSSFARLGLSVHCTGDFLNPGYRGHMPLQLINFSPNPIRIFPYLPICQLMLVGLSSTPAKIYGAAELQSKYMDDDGGPSYWWRDKRIAQVQAVFRSSDIALDTQEFLLRRIGVEDPEIIERFEKFVERMATAKRENADAILDTFAATEDRLRIRDRIVKGASYVFFGIFGSAAAGSVLVQPLGWLHYSIWAATALLAWPFIAALMDSPKSYFGQKELSQSLGR